MGTEIERKFLIDHDMFMGIEVIPRGLAPLTRTRISQGYLSRKPAVRVRHSSTGPNRGQGFLTVKGSGNITRSEWDHVADTRAVAALRAMRDDVVLELRLMATRAT